MLMTDVVCLLLDLSTRSTLTVLGVFPSSLRLMHISQDFVTSQIMFLNCCPAKSLLRLSVINASDPWGRPPAA